MKNMLKNKKGFTLVELLAVIVILALLIVITANTVLPMMNKSKKNGMVVYAERVLNAASANFQADSITSTIDSKNYSIGKLMGESNYYGCVKVTKSGDTYTYNIAMFSDDADLGIIKKSVSSVTGLAEADATNTDYTKRQLASADAAKEDTNCTESSPDVYTQK